MPVYVLTVYYYENEVGEPEDCGIIGIFSSSEKAKIVAKHMEKNDEMPPHYMGYSITEYELDSVEGALGDV